MTASVLHTLCIQRKNVLEDDHIFLVVALVGCFQSFVSLKSFFKECVIGIDLS